MRWKFGARELVMVERSEFLSLLFPSAASRLPSTDDSPSPLSFLSIGGCSILSPISPLDENFGVAKILQLSIILGKRLVWSNDRALQQERFLEVM